MCIIRRIFTLTLTAVFLAGCGEIQKAPSPGPELLVSLPASEGGQTIILHPGMRGPVMPLLTGVCYVGDADLVRQIDPRLIQFDQIFDLRLSVSMDSDGRLTQDLSKLDSPLEAIHQSDARPLIALDFTPTVLSPQPHLENSARRSLPPVSYEDWEQLVYEVVRYVVHEKQVHVAYWSVWNEPDFGMFWNVTHRPYTRWASTARGTDLWTPLRARTGALGQLNELGRIVEYMRLYEATVKGVRRADPTAKVGGPNTSSFNERWIAVFLNQCVERGLPVDFVSWHYPGYPDAMKETMHRFKRLSEKAGMMPPEVVITEWNADHGAGWPVWQKTVESLKIIQGMAASGVSAAFYYAVGSLIQTDTRTLSLLGTAFRHLATLQGRQIKCEVSSNIRAMAIVEEDGAIRSIFWSEGNADQQVSIRFDDTTDFRAFSSYTLNLYHENAPARTITGSPDEDGTISFPLPSDGRYMGAVTFYTGTQIP